VHSRSGVGWNNADTDEAQKRKGTDPEKWFSNHC
jgi:hypothetical protein